MRAANLKSANVRGFTLIELIVVMALLTAAVTLAAPRLASFFKGRLLDSEARRVTTLIRYAQDRAGSEGVNMRLWIDSPNNRFGVEPEVNQNATTTGLNSNNRSQQDPMLTFEVDSGIKITSSGAAPTRQIEGYRGSGLPQRLTTTTRAQSRLPAIVCLPDGTFEAESPETIELTDSEGFKVTISQARNRLGYEIVTR